MTSVTSLKIAFKQSELTKTATALALIFNLAIACLLVVSIQEAESRNKELIKSYVVENQVYELCKQSDQLISSGNYSAAVKALQQAALQDPTSYSSYVHENLCQAYRLSKQYQKALEEGKISMSFEPSNMGAMYELAVTYFDMEHFDTAAQHLKKMIKQSKDSNWTNTAQKLLADIDTHGNSAVAYKAMQEGHLEKARKLYLEASKHDPSDVSAHAHANLAWIDRRLGKPELAIEEAKKSLKYRTDKDVIFGLAIAYQDIGDFDNAIAWLKRYIELEDDQSKRSKAAEEIEDLRADKARQRVSFADAPDYYEHSASGEKAVGWPKQSFPLKIYVHEGAGVKGYQKSFPSYIWHALETWSQASGNKLSFQKVTKKDKADIEVRWISEPVMLPEGKRMRVKQGVAERDQDGDYISHVLVRIDTMNSYDPDRKIEESEAASICMHEIGHALGLEHSPNLADIMYFGSSSKQSGMPTARDKATIARIYQNYPVSKSAPIQKQVPQIKFLPPPAFMPPSANNDDDLKIPVFLPPPVQDESDKLTPPFFMPPPVDTGTSSSGRQQESKNAKLKEKAPPPPAFLPPPINAGKTKQGNPEPSKHVNGNGSKSQRQENSDPRFFAPPPAK